MCPAQVWPQTHNLWTGNLVVYQTRHMSMLCSTLAALSDTKAELQRSLKVTNYPTTHIRLHLEFIIYTRIHCSQSKYMEEVCSMNFETQTNPATTKWLLHCPTTSGPYSALAHSALQTFPSAVYRLQRQFPKVVLRNYNNVQRNKSNPYTYHSNCYDQLGFYVHLIQVNFFFGQLVILSWK